MNIEIGSKVVDIDGIQGEVVDIDLEAPYTDSDEGACKVQWEDQIGEQYVEIDWLEQEETYFIPTTGIDWMGKKLRHH